MIRDGRRSEAGATLVEVLVAVMVLGIAFVALIGAFGVSIASSDLHRKQAVAETAIRRYAEAAKQVSCLPTCPATASSYSAANLQLAPYNFTLPPGFVANAPKCRDATGAYVDTCLTTGVQVVKLSIATTDNRVDANLELVRRPG